MLGDVGVTPLLQKEESNDTFVTLRLPFLVLNGSWEMFVLAPEF